MLDRVTITGADDQTSPIELVELSEEFSFVEWGVLLSEKWTGEPRYPSLNWIAGLKTRCDRWPETKLSLHVCGRYSRDILAGSFSFAPSLLEGFDRVQINGPDVEPPDQGKPLWKLLMDNRKSPAPGRQWIFQVREGNRNRAFEAIHSNNDPDFCWVDAVPLFDASGGNGVLPIEWPRPFFFDDQEDTGYHGYAGGLGPENLAEQLPRIKAAADDCWINMMRPAAGGPDFHVLPGDPPTDDLLAEIYRERRNPGNFWIDMESGVRTDNQFDLARVRRVLEIAAPFIGKE